MLIGAGTVKDFSEIIFLEQVLFGLIIHRLDKRLFRDELNVLIFLNEEFLEQIAPIDRALFFDFGCLSDFG